MDTSGSLDQLREGFMLDYEMRTWEVKEHKTYEQEGWPADEWRLTCGGDVLFLEHEYVQGDLFRLLRPADITDVTVEGEPFLAAVREEDPPNTVTYQGEEYVLAEEDARIQDSSSRVVRSRSDAWLMGVCGGIAEHLDIPPTYARIGFIAAILVSGLFSGGGSGCLLIPGYFIVGTSMSKAPPSPPRDDLSHYWVYQGKEGFVAFQCLGSNDWDMYAGREVEPYEFDNILPRASS